MHRRNLIVLSVLVLALCALAWWQVRREGGERQPAAPGVLLPDVASESVRAVRIDNLERSVQMRAERRDDGWWIVDPIEYPFAPALVAPLFDALFATPAQPWEGAAAQHGFDPPRAVLTVEIEGPAGPQRRRIELGAVDVDAQRVFARVDGRLLRTLRNLETLLDRPVDEWRSRQILPIAPTEVVALVRSGRLALPGREEALELDLSLELAERWRATSPFTAELAPERVGALLTSLCYLQVAGFEDDLPGPLEHYGLEPPDLRVSLATADGRTYALRLGFVPGREAVRVKREDRPQIFTVAREFLGALLLPSDTLVDDELLRVPRERLQAFEIARGDGSVRFERAGFGWTVQSEGTARLPKSPADAAAVDALVAGIEKARVAEVLPGREHEFGPLDLHVSFLVDGTPRGWSVGGAIDGARGTRGRAFRRDGDTLLGLVADDLSAWLELDPQAYVSRELHRVREIDLVRAEVASPWAGLHRRWERSAQGRWSPEGSSAEALDFVGLVDALLNQRAARQATAAEAERAVRPIDVTLLDVGGQARAAFTLSLLPDEGDPLRPREVLYRSRSRSAVVEGHLYAELARLLDLRGP